MLLAAGRAGSQIGAAQVQNAQQSGMQMAMSALIAQHPPSFRENINAGGNVKDLPGFSRLPPQARSELENASFSVVGGPTNATYRIEGPGSYAVVFERLNGTVEQF